MKYLLLLLLLLTSCGGPDTLTTAPPQNTEWLGFLRYYRTEGQTPDALGAMGRGKATTYEDGFMFAPGSRGDWQILFDGQFELSARVAEYYMHPAKSFMLEEAP